MRARARPCSGPHPSLHLQPPPLRRLHRLLLPLAGCRMGLSQHPFTLLQCCDVCLQLSPLFLQGPDLRPRGPARLLEALEAPLSLPQRLVGRSLGLPGIRQSPHQAGDTLLGSLQFDLQGVDLLGALRTLPRQSGSGAGAGAEAGRGMQAGMAAPKGHQEKDSVGE